MHGRADPPHVFWLFGLSGAGKSTLAGALAAELRREHRPVLALDGDDLRSGLCHGLGFTDADRTENLRRAAEAAKLGLRSDLCVVASFITPLEQHRQLVAETLGLDVSFVFIDAPLAVCRHRDVKGLYARADAGRVPQMTGITSGFVAPAECALRIDTATATLAESVALLTAFARRILRTGAAVIQPGNPGLIRPPERAEPGPPLHSSRP